MSTLLAHSTENADDRALDMVIAADAELLLNSHHGTPSPESTLVDWMVERSDLEAVRALLTTAYGVAWTMLVYILSGETLLVSVITPEDLTLEQIPYDSQLQLPPPTETYTIEELEEAVARLRAQLEEPAL